MLTQKDYCDYDTCVALCQLDPKMGTLFDICDGILLYEAQKWLMTQGIHIAPRIYLYHDINLDEQVSWECNIYVEWSAIFTIGKSLTYEDALLEGIKEAVKLLKKEE